MRAILLGLLFVVLLSAVNGFAPSRVSRVPCRTVKISAAKDSIPFLSFRIPMVLAPFVLPAAVFAAEGTGRAFGIDDSRLIWAAIFPALIIFPLYSKWSKDQEGDDFFDGYEKRRNG